MRVCGVGGCVVCEEKILHYTHLFGGGFGIKNLLWKMWEWDVSVSEYWGEWVWVWVWNLIGMMHTSTIQCTRTYTTHIMPTDIHTSKHTYHYQTPGECILEERCWLSSESEDMFFFGRDEDLEHHTKIFDSLTQPLYLKVKIRQSADWIEYLYLQQLRISFPLLTNLFFLFDVEKSLIFGEVFI